MPQIRNQSLDLMRAMAAFGIVWAHMQAPWMEVGYLALALFVMLTTGMAVFSAESRSFGRFMRGRFWRIFLPWLVWCGLYLALEAGRSGNLSRFWQLTDWQSLLVGPYEHLWFLPFVIITAPLAFLSSRVLRDARSVWLATVPLAVLGCVALALHDSEQLDAPWAQWACAAVPLFYGLLWVRARVNNARLAPLAFVAVATLIPTFAWNSEPAPYLLASAVLFEIFWRVRISHPLLPALGALSFGVYLVHPFILLVWYKISHDALPRALGAVVVFVLSLVAAVVIEWLWSRILPRRKGRAQVEHAGVPSPGHPA